MLLSEHAGSTALFKIRAVICEFFHDLIRTDLLIIDIVAYEFGFIKGYCKK